jgi:hypothetical protein
MQRECPQGKCNEDEDDDDSIQEISLKAHGRNILLL